MPSLLCDVTSADFVESTIVSALIGAKVSDKRSNIVGLESLSDLLGHDSLGHAGASEGSDAVRKNVPLFALLGKRLSEAPKAELGSSVVSLAKGAVDAST